KLVPGVHMKQAGGVRGVHFSSPHTSMSFPSSQLLVNCDLFPEEFSIVLTLKVSSIAPRVKRERRVKSNEERGRVILGLRLSRKQPLQGQMWFNPLSKGLYLCDGTVWITVLEDHKRLDYLVEHQVLTTSSETHDVEVFQVPGIGLMAAMAHRSASGSAVYLWSHTGFQLYQNISTYEALAWRHFSMGKKIFLVVSNSGGGPDKRQKSETDYSVIYKWSKRRKRFVQFQTLQTHCARDWEAFNINRQTYLAVANHRQGDKNHTIDSVIYKWNRLTKSFEVHQMLLTSGAYDWEFFTVGPYHFLVVANAFDGVTTSVDSVIYVWVNGSFQVFQTIKVCDWEFFSLGEEYFLVVANSFNGESYSLNSILYRYSTCQQHSSQSLLTSPLSKVFKLKTY
uniref:Thrombospondin type laminin G domain and EAR repeats n=1 Tax=Sander lucioperca TaxID=283035 RepID=A0A8D0CV62_SANLU